MRVSHWVVPLLTLALAGAVTFWEFDQRAAPGPLHPAHESRVELHGVAGCRHCHGSGADAVDAGACGVCHVAVLAQLGTERGIHGSLPESQARTCAACHSEHHGAGTRLLGAHSFALAGVPDVARYDHAQIPGFGLSGRHDRLACSDCHPHAADASAPPARYLGLTQACTGCHEDPHRGRFGVGCAECHGQEGAFRAAPAFRHDALPLRDGHAAVACASCHVEGGAHGVAALRTTPQPARACDRCHQDPHAAASGVDSLSNSLPSLRRVDTHDCARCHTATRWRDGAVTATTHAELGFALTAPHDDVACAKCHAGESRAERFPGRAPTDCRACHRDPHAGQFDHEPRYGQCTACHASERFTPPSFDLTAHARTSFPLTGAHEGVGCTLCHGSMRGDARMFHGTAQACAACHRDVHAGAFDRAGAPREVAGRRGCARCHGTEAFTPVTAGAFDHGAWTGHALVGAHARLDCTLCHERSATSTAGGRRLGPAAGRACADCHADPHLAQFAVGGRTDCARCHGETSFSGSHFDHQRDSAFTLDETHRGLACVQCHRPTVVGGRRVVKYKPLGVRCGDCHVLDNGKVRR